MSDQKASLIRTVLKFLAGALAMFGIIEISSEDVDILAAGAATIIGAVVGIIGVVKSWKAHE